MENNLENLIRLAFDTEPYPGLNKIFIWEVPPLNIVGQHDDEDVEIYESMKGKLRGEFDLPFLRKNVKELGTFSNAGFRYFLPEFLIAAINPECPEPLIGILVNQLLHHKCIKGYLTWMNSPEYFQQLNTELPIETVLKYYSYSEYKDIYSNFNKNDVKWFLERIQYLSIEQRKAVYYTMNHLDEQDKIVYLAVSRPEDLDFWKEVARIVP